MKRLLGGTGGTGGGGTPGGSTTQVQYNNAGAFGGISTFTYDGSTLTTAGRFINSYNATASSPAKAFAGTWFTGGTGTTTKPHLLIEPTGTSSGAWNNNGTGLGINAASGFIGRYLDLQRNGSSLVNYDINGLVINNAAGAQPLRLCGGALNTIYNSNNDLHLTTNGFDVHIGKISDVATGITVSTVSGLLTAKNGIAISNSQNIALGTTTGTKIGTATTQKLGFFDKTPVVQPVAVADATTSVDVITQFNALLSRMRDLGLIAT